jgi:hypothetical protein
MPQVGRIDFALGYLFDQVRLHGRIAQTGGGEGAVEADARIGVADHGADNGIAAGHATFAQPTGRLDAEIYRRGQRGCSF